MGAQNTDLSISLTALLSHERDFEPIACDLLALIAIFAGFHVLSGPGLELASVQYASSPRLRTVLQKPAVTITAAKKKLAICVHLRIISRATAVRTHLQGFGFALSESGRS